MSRIVSLSVLCVVLPFMAGSAIPPTQKETEKIAKPPTVEWDGWCGYWEVVGDQGVGKPKYVGIVTIKRKAAVALVQWSVGGTTFMGIGRVLDGKLIVGWHHADMVGLTIYTKQPGEITGEYISLPGAGVVLKESLTLLKKTAPGE